MFLTANASKKMMFCKLHRIIKMVEQKFGWLSELSEIEEGEIKEKLEQYIEIRDMAWTDEDVRARRLAIEHFGSVAGFQNWILKWRTDTT